jgi:hypothetical protein
MVIQEKDVVPLPQTSRLVHATTEAREKINITSAPLALFRRAQAHAGAAEVHPVS